jgi:hypothetical protein
MTDYVNVGQGTIKHGRPEDTIGSFGASTCVIVAAVNGDGSCLVAHIDALTSDLIVLFEVGSKVTMMETTKNKPFLQYLALRCPSKNIKIKEGSSLMVHNSVVTLNVGPPIHVDEAVLKKTQQLLEMAKASRDAYEPNMKGRARPPAPGLDFYWDSKQFKWMSFGEGGSAWF